MTWQTEFYDEVPYKKGDVIEYTKVFTSSDARYIQLDISNVKKNIDITEIEINDIKSAINDAISLNLQDASIVKIT